MKNKLFYGLKLKHVETGEIFTVEKYWPDDTDANSYKVRLGKGSFYSSDLSELIESGFFQIFPDKQFDNE